MPYSKPIPKQQLLLPERKNFIRLSLIHQRNILERLSVDNLIGYLNYIINDDDGDNINIGHDENVRSSGNNIRFTPEGHYLVEQIADDHNNHNHQFVGAYKRFSQFFPMDDVSNRINDESYVLDWIAKHSQPQQQQQQQQPLSVITGNGSNIINANPFSSWNNGLNNQQQQNIPYSNFSIDNNINRIEVVDLNPSPQQSTSSSSQSSSGSTSTSLLNNQFTLMECSSKRYYPMENLQQQGSMMINNSMINLERKDTQMFDSFRLPSSSVFNRMSMEDRIRLLSTLPSQVKNKYEFYCWSSNTSINGQFFNGGDGDDDGRIIY